MRLIGQFNPHILELYAGIKKPPYGSLIGFILNGGMDGTRTRDPLRDRQVF